MVVRDEEIMMSSESAPYDEQGYLYNAVVAHPVVVSN